MAANQSPALLGKPVKAQKFIASCCMASCRGAVAYLAASGAATFPGGAGLPGLCAVNRPRGTCPLRVLRKLVSGSGAAGSHKGPDPEQYHASAGEDPRRADATDSAESTARQYPLAPIHSLQGVLVFRHHAALPAPPGSFAFASLAGHAPVPCVRGRCCPSPTRPGLCAAAPERPWLGC